MENQNENLPPKIYEAVQLALQPDEPLLWGAVPTRKMRYRCKTEINWLAAGWLCTIIGLLCWYGAWVTRREHPMREPYENIPYAPAILLLITAALIFIGCFFLAERILGYAVTDRRILQVTRDSEDNTLEVVAYVLRDDAVVTRTNNQATGLRYGNIEVTSADPNATKGTGFLTSRLNGVPDAPKVEAIIQEVIRTLPKM